MGINQGRLARMVTAGALVCLGMVSGGGPARASWGTGHAQRAAQARDGTAEVRANATGPGTRLYVADWSRGFGGWTTKDRKPLRGSGWSVAGGQLVSDGRAGASIVARAPYEPGKHRIADYALEAQMRVLGINMALPAPHGFGQWARGQGLDNNYGYTAGLVADQTPQPQLYSQAGVSTSFLAGKQFVQFDPLAWHTYREEVVGPQIRYLIDGVVVLSAKSDGWKYGGWVGLSASGTRIAVRSFTLRTLSRPSSAYAPPCGASCGAGAVLYQTSWGQGAHSLLDWSAPRGDPQGWTVQNGMLLTNGGPGGLVRPDFAPGDLGLSSYAVEAQIKLLALTPPQNPVFALRIHGQGIESNYGFEGQLITRAHDAVSALIYDPGNGSGLGGKRFVVFDPAAWHNYRVQVAITSVQYLIDGVPVVSTSSTAWGTYGGFAGISFSGVKIAIRRFRIISLRGTTLPSVAPCSPHCGPSGVGYVLPTSSFSARNLLDWELINGTYNTWRLAGGTLVGSPDGASLIKPDYEPGAWKRADYRVQAEFSVVRQPSGTTSYGVIARGQGIEYGYGYQADLEFNGKTWDAVLWSRANGQLARKAGYASFPPGSWHRIGIDVRGAQIQMLVDGAVVLSASDKYWKYGGWGGVIYGNSGPEIAIRGFTID